MQVTSRRASRRSRCSRGSTPSTRRLCTRRCSPASPSSRPSRPARTPWAGAAQTPATGRQSRTGAPHRPDPQVNTNIFRFFLSNIVFQITGAAVATQRSGGAAAGTAGAGTGRGPTSATTEARTSGGSSSATTARRRARLRTSPSRKGDHSPFFNLHHKHFVAKCCYVVLTSYLQYYILLTISCQYSQLCRLRLSSAAVVTLHFPAAPLCTNVCSIHS